MSTHGLRIAREDPNTNPGSVLIHALVNELAERYHEIADEILNSTYYPELAPENGSIFVVAYLNDMPIGCAAIHPYCPKIAEVKRLYVAPSARGNGISKALMQALEEYANDYGYNKIILETGVRQPEAMRLYERIGYTEIPIYDGITDLDYSVCYEKQLIHVK